MAEEKLANLNANLKASREQLTKIWADKRDNQAVTAICTKTWNGWSVAVRQDYLKRAQAAVVAGVQTSVPRKQWAQWVVTLKFCLEDIFAKARETHNKEFAAAGGLSELLKIIVDGKENTLNPEAFDKKIKEMLEEMKTNKIDGFDVNDQSHGPTLRAIRSIYAIQWANY